MKRILIILFLFLLIPLDNVSAIAIGGGCHGEYKPILDSINVPSCFLVEPDSCLGRMRFVNNCNSSYKFYNAKNCIINYDTKVDISVQLERLGITDIKNVEDFFSDEYILIPPKWDLTYYPPNWEHQSISLKRSTVLLLFDCELENINIDNFKLDLGDDSNNYLAEGYYGGRVKMNLFYLGLISVLIILLFIGIKNLISFLYKR